MILSCDIFYLLYITFYYLLLYYIDAKYFLYVGPKIIFCIHTYMLLFALTLSKYSDVTDTWNDVEMVNFNFNSVLQWHAAATFTSQSLPPISPSSCICAWTAA